MWRKSMIGRLAFVVVTVLSLSGCIVGDGIAHVVKLTEQNQKKSEPAPAADSTANAPTAVAPRDVAPPPPPAAAPSRSAVSVETLGPPSP
jgi:hypothetical protein